LRANPSASVAEEDALEDADLAVVFGRLLVLHAADTRGLLFDCILLCGHGQKRKPYGARGRGESRAARRPRVKLVRIGTKQRDVRDRIDRAEAPRRWAVGVTPSHVASLKRSGSPARRFRSASTTKA